MNDDDMLFGLEDIEAWKRRMRPESWLQERKDVLVARDVPLRISSTRS